MKVDLMKAENKRGVPIYWLVYFCLIGYSALVVFNTNDFGFQGDDFWYISAPFLNGFRQAFIKYVLPYDRPLGIVYVFSLFKLFGFSRIPYLALDFLLQATTSLFFGWVIFRVFPRQRTLVFFSMLFSFFLLPSASALYIMAMTTARLGCLIFWLSVLMFQWWAQKPFWHRMIIPVVLYVVSFLLYDATSLLIFTVPIFVYPVWYWSQITSTLSLGEIYLDLLNKLHLSITRKINLFLQPEIVFIIKLAIGLFICAGLFLINLFVLFPFGASRISHAPLNIPLIFNYIIAILKYLIVPLTYISFNGWTLVISILLLASLLIILFRRHSLYQLDDSPLVDNSWQPYASVAGFGIFLIGIFPFIVSQYGTSLGFNTQGRIFFSAVYGFSILVSIIIVSWKATIIKRLFEIAGVIIITASAVFLADLRIDWHSAAQTNCNLWSSMIEQVPAVKNGAIFLFLDLQSYYQGGKIMSTGNRAIVFTGVDALPLYIQMLYGNTSLSAYYLYRQDMGHLALQSEERIAVVTANGVKARGSLELPKDKIVILERQGDRLVLVDKFTSKDGNVAIIWKDGINELVTNRDQIITGDIPSKRYKIIWGHVCR